MKESADVTCFAQCASCGKATFIDLLDQEMRCEYCREAHRARRHPLSKKTKAEHRGSKGPRS